MEQQRSTSQNERVQRATSADGTEIAARIHGSGPPLVLVHGGFADGETAWRALIPELVDRFTCYSMSTRGRGLSSPGIDPSPLRLIEDVVAMVESIGEPAPTFGLSMGALLSLSAAQQTEAISAVVAYEPGVFQVMDAATSEGFFGVILEVAELAEAGRHDEAIRRFGQLVTNPQEQANPAVQKGWELAARNVDVQIREFAGVGEYEGPSPFEPEELAKIAAPVLLLHGTRSVPDPWFTDAVHYVARHVPQGEIRAVEGAGHLGPTTHPEAVAGEIASFLATTLQPAG